MIIWMNGTFGVGKTTTADHLVAKSDRLRIFDPEWVGYLLANNLADHEFTDFQQLSPWRALVPVVADEIVTFTGQHLVAVQTVLHQDYWHELMDGLRARGHDIRKWRHEHVEKFMTERPWLLASADLVVDTAAADAESAAAAVFEKIQAATALA